MAEVSKGTSRWAEMTPVEAEIIAPIFPAVEQLAADEVLAMHRQARESHAELDRPLASYLEWSPRYNLPRARELYTAFAEAPAAEDRVQAGYMIAFLTPYDHELGVQLWSQLLRDPDQRVREAALEELHRPLADDRAHGADAGQWIEKFGITWEDACLLYTDFVEASM
jgi:hypothetical protein